jgi:hypothetical protein
LKNKKDKIYIILNKITNNIKLSYLDGRFFLEFFIALPLSYFGFFILLSFTKHAYSWNEIFSFGAVFAFFYLGVTPLIVMIEMYHPFFGAIIFIICNYYIYNKINILAIRVIFVTLLMILWEFYAMKFTFDKVLI